MRLTIVNPDSGFSDSNSFFSNFLRFGGRKSSGFGLDPFPTKFPITIWPEPSSMCEANRGTDCMFTSRTDSLGSPYPWFSSAIFGRIVLCWTTRYNGKLEVVEVAEKLGCAEVDGMSSSLSTSSSSSNGRYFSSSSESANPSTASVSSSIGRITGCVDCTRMETGASDPFSKLWLRLAELGDLYLKTNQVFPSHQSGRTKCIL